MMMRNTSACVKSSPSGTDHSLDDVSNTCMFGQMKGKEGKEKLVVTKMVVDVVVVIEKTRTSGKQDMRLTDDFFCGWRAQPMLPTVPRHQKKRGIHGETQK